ncbi:unnamed protein product [Dibothriocephalus latus]|uniref:Uncharacterized protein n=1 Tax=Dibothriocephalus latus TaxID=60516 RepID=A0A3P7LJK6_DIBLA|nr:unnamed protein product [Dibothriocephalus latus]
MGDTLTSEMGRSLAFADNSASPVTLTTSTAALATSQPVDSVTDPCSPDFLDNREKAVEGEETQRHQPATNPTSPRPHSPRTQDDAVRSEDHLEDDANTTTTSSEIEVISCCTSVNGEASNGSGNSTAVLLAATEQFLQGTECPQDLSSRDRSLCHLVRPVSGRRSSNPTVANRPSESALREDLSQLLEAREAKILELSRENISLQEANAFLQSQVAQAAGSGTGNLHELDSLTDEFTRRLALTERRLQAVTKERNQLRAQLASEPRHLPDKSSAAETSSEKALQYVLLHLLLSKRCMIGCVCVARRHPGCV